MNLSAVLGGGYVAFLSLFVATVFGEHYRRHGVPPRRAARRAYRCYLRADLREDIEAIGGYGLREWIHTAVTTVLMPAIVGRTVIHAITYLVANPDGRPDVHVPRLFASPLTPRPAWNDLSARVVAFLITVEYGRSMWAAWALSVNSELIAAYVLANAALLVADLPAGIIIEAHAYLTNNA